MLCVIIDASNDYGWWYMTNGALDWSYTGMASNEFGWWYKTNGEIYMTYTGKQNKKKR